MHIYMYTHTLSLTHSVPSADVPCQDNKNFSPCKTYFSYHTHCSSALLTPLFGDIKNIKHSERIRQNFFVCGGLMSSEN